MNSFLKEFEMQVADGGAVRLLSVDIFDTLLFRAVGEPAEVFERMVAMQRGLIPAHLDGVEWRNLRVHAEREARRLKHGQTGNREVTLTEIYAALPKMFTQRDDLMKVELAAEKSVCFLNPQIVGVIKHARLHMQCRVILLSDMYFSEEQLSDLLRHAGFDLNLVDSLFVSSENGISKKDGGLFDLALSRYGVDTKDVLHIGDNLLGDVAAPARRGIRTAHYDLISGSVAHHPFLEVESMKFKRCMPGLHALRCLAADQSRTASDEERAWRQMGAMIFGPLCTGFAEWVLDKAEESKIVSIYPFMREGAFFSRLLKAAESFRSSAFNIRPLYVSRKSLFLPSLCDVGLQPDHLDYILHMNDIRVQDLFDMLGIDATGGTLSEYLSLMIGETRDVMLGEESACDRLKAHLLTDEVQAIIRINAARARDALLHYLASLGFGEGEAITLDIGYRGTMQGLLEQVLDRSGARFQFKHLLMTGNEQTVTSLMRGVEIEGYLGTCGSNVDDLEQCHIRLLDLFMMCDEGSTIGYEMRDDCGVPVLERQGEINRDQARQTRWLQAGVLDYLGAWHDIYESAQPIRELRYAPGDLFRPIARLMTAPLSSEAQALGRWSYDENMVAQRLVSVIDPAHLERFKEIGLSQYLSDNHGRRMEWYAGMMALQSPYFFIKQHLAARNGFEKMKRAIYAERVLSVVAPDEMLVIAGAGEAGQDLLRYLRIGRPEVQVEAFIDNNEMLHGSRVLGIEVSPFSQRFRSRCYVIGSLEYELEIRQQLMREKGDSIRIVQFRG